jgi:AAA ATPase domain
LKNLVVFVGPNNTGKSFVATIMYASLSQTAVVSGPRLARTLRRTRSRDDDLDAEIIEFLSRDFPGRAVPPFEFMGDQLRSYFNEVIESSFDEYASSIIEEIRRTTGVPLPMIRRIANKRAVPAVIEIKSASPSWTITIEVRAESTTFSVRLPELADAWQSMNPAVFRRLRRRAGRSLSAPPNYLLSETTSELVRVCFREVPPHTKYLPAARSGILQSHRALAGSLVRRSTLAGIEDLRVPAMSGVVADFLSEMIELEASESGDFNEDALSLEDKILHGHIVPGSTSSYPEVVYNTTTGDFPLGRTSSMVSELAPVVLYLRHRLRIRDLLLIEEPEAHLHPATQIVFAQALVRLVNHGLRVVLTTHSEFFLQQINNAIAAGALHEDKIVEAGVSPENGLQGDRVAAYNFEPTNSGTVVTELPVDTKEGISDSSFGLVSERLYNEAVALDRSAEFE